MALPASGQISLSQFRTTFGGSVPDSVSEYYRGGSNVANNAINVNIPQSGTASFSDYYSGAGTQTRNVSIRLGYISPSGGVGLTTISSTGNPFFLLVAAQIKLHISRCSTLEQGLLPALQLQFSKTRMLPLTQSMCFFMEAHLIPQQQILSLVGMPGQVEVPAAAGATQLFGAQTAK
jgi:hypothetical protein